MIKKLVEKIVLTGTNRNKMKKALEKLNDFKGL